MDLSKKKELAKKTLGVGKNRIVFNTEGLSEIKEAITKQDIRDLHNEGIITIKPIKGRKKIVKRKTRRGPGKIKKKVSKRKQIYVKITRKLRKYIMGLKDQQKIPSDLYRDLRKKIRMRFFRSKNYLKSYVDKVINSPDEISKETQKKPKKSKSKRSRSKK